MNENLAKSTFIPSGTVRKERMLKALLPQNLLIDARGLPEWLAFLTHAAQLIGYFDQDNNRSKTIHWDTFLKKDPSVLLALLMEENPGDWDKEFKLLIRRYYSTTGGDDKQKSCIDLLRNTIELATCLDDWFRDSESLLKWKRDSPVRNILSQAIQGDLGTAFREFRDILAFARSSGLLSLKDDIHAVWDTFHAAWGLHYPVKPVDLKGDNPDERLDSVVEDVRQIFQRLFFTMTYVVEKAPDWFRESIEQKNDHDPHIGLLLTFLQLFRHLRDQVNTYPEKHLHHYYFDLLKQVQRPHQPDKTVVCFRLAEQTDTYLLEKGTLLLAEINEQGLASHYATTSELLLTQAKVAQLKTLYVGQNYARGINSYFRLKTGLYVAPKANSRDGQGLPFGVEDKSWAVFGEEQVNKSPRERNMTDASIGFVLAAPIFALREGRREVDLKFCFSTASFSQLMDLLQNIQEETQSNIDLLIRRIFIGALKVFATGAKGWFLIEKWHLNTSAEWVESKAITMTLSLLEQDPAIVDHVPGTLVNEDYDTTWPLIKILIDPEHSVYPYSFLYGLELESITIETRVKGIKSLTLFNDLGLLDTSSPFFPFGPAPKRNAYMLIGHSEWFRKKLMDLSIHIEWNNLPDLAGGFAEYYREYEQGIDNTSFKVRISALSNHQFRPDDAENQSVYTLFESESPQGQLLEHTDIPFIDLDRLQIQRDYSARSLPEYSNTARSGYIKLLLSQPNMAFGHANYPRLFAQGMIAQAKPTGLFRRSNDQNGQLPREPYTPVINQITASYTAIAKLNLKPLQSGTNDLEAQEKIFCLHPFGKQEIFAKGVASSRFLFPHYEENGYLYIGLEAVKPGTLISMLFHIQESKQKVRSDTLEVTWNYLYGNRWLPLTQEMLLSDETRRFSTTGKVCIAVPSDITTDSSIMPPGLFWLRASANGNLSVAGRVLSVDMNAVEAVWVDNGDMTHFDPARNLPPIRELVQQRSEIANLVQHIGFYDGLAAEALPDFYVRVSERLRHKNRAISCWDVEHLTLQHFPFLREAKCITPNHSPEVAPGSLLLVVVAQTTPTDAEPLLGFEQLERIGEFLSRLASPFAHVHVINPVYEKIKMSCTIQLKKGLEKEEGAYAKRLHEEFLQFVCPWLSNGPLTLGGRISRADVLTFLNSRPYIQFATRLSLVKLYDRSEDERALKDTARGGESLELLTTENPWSVLTPVAQHNIEFQSSDSTLQPEVAAIETMRLGVDFVVQGETDVPSAAIQDASRTAARLAKEEDEEDDWYLAGG